LASKKLETALYHKVLSISRYLQICDREMDRWTHFMTAKAVIHYTA